MIELSSLFQLEKDGLITLKSNNDGNLFIANYTPKVQYERLWTDLLLLCRGIIIDKEGQIKARPFPKFFNLEEYQVEDLPIENFEVYEKLDGSLGILYFNKDWQIATRGSFYSEQAAKATELLHLKYSQYLNKFEKNRTYLFEIIYPKNRIVINYGDRELLVLLAIIDTQTGLEYSIEDFDFPEKVKKYDGIKDLNTLKTLENANGEGFVIKFASGFRVKVKFDEYLRLHKLITQVTNKTIWEYLAGERNFEEILDRVPDEFYGWVKEVRQEFQSKFDKKYKEINAKYKNATKFDTRKEFAEWAKKQSNPDLLFALLDGKRIDAKIWKLIKPEYEKPYRILFNLEN